MSLDGSIEMRILFLMLVSVAGCSRDEPNHSASTASTQIAQIDIRSGPTATEILEAADESSPVPADEEWSLQDKDRELIELLVKTASPEPILGIRIVGPFHVNVTTGVTNATLSSGGQFFECKKENGRWRIVNQGAWVS